ncbi:MAG: hypothetical protein KKE51_08995 [Gammaproteobacteria bacterium]|nr:hypothetical protein [Gammaproteobacteria bacterium]MBU1602528.1 hypothetical protein [Gammaproteobacteria bacterium]MBU2433333.1 hypothetical protein [Gammaproteobacteria bacterium]MBU2451249.1 hypothetical protein [Gammaproteobacteria bacterium]
MTAVALKPQPAPDVTDAARALGRRGGRPKGSFSSPLAAWLRKEVKQKQREGWGRREGFNIAANTERPIDDDSFQLTERTAEEAEIETVDEEGNDRPATVSWAYWKKIWLEVQNGNRFP